MSQYLSISGLRAAPDAHAADWLLERLEWNTPHVVGSIAPKSFEKYARILHPATRLQDGSAFVSWGEIAATDGTPLRSTTQWERLKSGSDVRLTPPAVGRLPRELFSVLIDSTNRLASSAWLYLAAWDSGDPALTEGPTFGVPLRTMRLFVGSADALREGRCGVSDNLAAPPINAWWPESKDWYVATDVDLNSTYMGGSSQVIQHVIDSPELESFEVSVDDDISALSDG